MLEKLISGGQTGVDRAALDAALRREFPCGGWCPRGRRAEDGCIPPHYPLAELGSSRYLDRTRRNVAESGATLILSPRPLTGGTRATERYARELGKPCLVVDPEPAERESAARCIRDWLDRAGIRVLNVAGPRESSCPGIAARAEAVVGAVLDGISSS
tara:strand:+ start:7085 stop:7558 length:474 start_codon:yes stop_codon:yes gene_type:complete